MYGKNPGHTQSDFKSKSFFKKLRRLAKFGQFDDGAKEESIELAIGPEKDYSHEKQMNMKKYVYLPIMILAIAGLAFFIFKMFAN